MKKEFSRSWISSKQPRKQRKYSANAPLHIKKRKLSTNLSKELRAKENKRSIVIRKEDKVKILRGRYRGKTGKVIEVFSKIGKVVVEGIQVKKQDGSKASVKLQPSNMQIIELTSRQKKETTKKSEKPVKEEKKIEKKETKTKPTAPQGVPQEKESRGKSKK